MLFSRPFCKVMAKKDIPIEIIEAAKELFFKHGFKRISIEDICNRAGVSRRTFYVYYENKTDLLIKLLEKIHEIQLKEFSAIKNSDLSFSEKLIQMTNYNIAQFEQVTPEFLADIHDTSFVEFRAHFEEKEKRWKEKTRIFFAEAQKRGDIRADLDIDFMHLFMDYAIATLKNDEMKKRYPDPVLLLRKIANILFYGILGKN